MARSRDQRAALVAGWQARRGGREEGPRHRCSSWSRDESRAARSDARRAQGDPAALRRARRRSASRPPPRSPRQEVWWPKAPLDGRAFPEGIHPPEGDPTFNESARLIGFLNGVCGGEFYIANLSAPKPHFRHTGQLDEDLSRWIKTRLVSNPTCLLASTRRRVHHHRLADALLGARRAARDHREIREALRRRARRCSAPSSNYVDQMRIGAGIEDVKWAQDYLQKWSGWI